MYKQQATKFLLLYPSKLRSFDVVDEKLTHVNQRCNTSKTKKKKGKETTLRTSDCGLLH